MEYLSGIIGQERALLPLRKALETGRINHAYLFIGPAGVGKRTTAEVFARSIILMEDSQGEAYLKENAHPDFMIIEKLENKTLIGIEQINREMEPWLALKPYRALRRVVIIKEAHLLSTPAANALLKTLEDPPGHAVIILVSSEQSLMETIISRCQLIRFSPLAEADIRDFLLTRGLEADRAAHLARLGQGSIAAAILWAEEEGLEELWDNAQTIIKDLSTGQEIEIFKCAEIIEKKPIRMASLLINLLRDIYICQATNQPQFLALESNHKMGKSFKRLDSARVQAALMNIEELRKQYRGPVNSLLLSINISYQLWDALK